jgi:NAD(P)-dependent dehydrogenase (short-subunit alcohol dehydrogenase family)
MRINLHGRREEDQMSGKAFLEDEANELLDNVLEITAPRIKISGCLKVLLFAYAFVAFILLSFQQLTQFQMKKFVIDFSQTANKIIIVTGANSGLGYNTALALAQHKARVVMACRRPQKCAEAQAKILAIAPYATVECIFMDLTSFKSVRHFAKEFTTRYDHLDVLVNNAGIMSVPKREETADGIESQIGTNHFGHFLLTALLFPHLSQNGRIVLHSSVAHKFAAEKFVFRDLLEGKIYYPWIAYGNSKLANLFFTFELNRKLDKIGNPKNITVVAAHPGYTDTNLLNSQFPFWEQINAIFAMRGPDGALSQIYGNNFRSFLCFSFFSPFKNVSFFSFVAAVDPHVRSSHNDYIGPYYYLYGCPSVQLTGKTSWDVVSQAKLWTESERITEQEFPIKQ